MEHVRFLLGIIAAATCFALIEIQIEGRAGWAANLPTWKLKSNLWRRLFPGRPLTGYHFWVQMFLLVVAHLPLAYGMPWSPGFEMRALAFILLFWVIEDFLWFVLNPHFGLRRFKPDYIPWHRDAWWWIAPRDYWIAGTAAVILYWSGQPVEVVEWVAATP